MNSGTAAVTSDIGNSALNISPMNYNFGLVSVSAPPGSITVVTQNVSQVPIYLSSISGPVDPNFQIVSNNCPASTTPMLPQSTCAVVVHFSPTVGGPLQYQLTAMFGTFPDDIHLTTQVTLTGIGVAQLTFAGLNPIDPNQVTTTTVPLSWTPVSGASSYTLYKSVVGSPLAIDGYASAGATTYMVQNLNANTAYSFQAKAMNALGQPDSNSLVQLSTTDALGSFSAPPVLASAEGGTSTSGDIGLNCTDAKSHYPSFMAIAAQSDPLSGCSLLTNPYRIQCLPGFKTGHASWNSTLTLTCLLDSWPNAYTQTLNVNVADTDRPPLLDVIGNQTLLAGTPIVPFAPGASDPDADTLTFGCRYDTLVEGSVAGGAALCSSLLNQNGSSASFSTTNGSFSWTPPMTSSGTSYEFQMTVNDGYSGSASRIAVINVGQAPPDPAQSVITLSSNTVGSGSSVVATLQAKNSTGINIPKGGASVTFSNSGGTSTGTFSAVFDHGDGTYTSTFTAVGSGTATAIHAQSQGSTVTSTAPTVVVTPGPISVARSLVALSSSSVSSGSTVNVVLTTKDANDNLIATGGHAVLFSRSGGTSSGSFSAVSDLGNGTYSSTFTASTAGTATTLGGSIDGIAFTSTLPQLTVSPGALSLAQSTLTLAGNATVVASGAAVGMSLQTRDSASNLLLAGGQSITFAALGGTSTGSISAVVDNGNGTYSATFTGAVSGTATTLRASVSGTPLTSTAPQISVVPGTASLSQSLLSVGTASLISGSTTSLTLVLRDSNGNAIQTGGSTVFFNRSGGTSTGNIITAVDNGNGTYSSTFTGVTSGTATTLGATLNAATLSSALPTITVSPGPLSLAQSNLSATATSVISGGVLAITLQAKDAAGNNLPSGGRTVVFSRSGGTSQGGFSGTIDHTDGTYASNFTGTTSGTATSLSATVDGSVLTSPALAVSVVPANLSLAQSTVVATAGTLTSGSTVTVTLTARDGTGNPFLAGGLTVAFANSGGTSTGSFIPVVDHADGTYSSVFTGLNSGTLTTLTASIGGAAVTNTLPTVSVNPGALSLSQSLASLSSASVASGSSVNLTLSTRDAHGNSIGAGGHTVLFTVSGGTSTGTLSAVTDQSNGTYTATFSGMVSGTAKTISATIDGSALTGAAPSLTVVPGPLSLAQTTVSVSSNTVVAGSTVTVSLATKDANGNNLGTGGQSISFARTGGTSTGSFSVVTDLNNGNYTAVFTGALAGTATAVSATVGGASVTSTLPTITVVAGSLSLAQSTISVSATSISSGATASLTLTTQDAGGNLLGTGGQTVVFSRTGGTSTGTISATVDNGDGTYTATYTAVTAGTANTINATVGGSAVVSALPTITVIPGVVSLSQSTVTVSATTLASGSNLTVTVTPKDANGNTYAVGGQTVIVAHSGGSTSGTHASTTDLGNGTYSSVFTGTTSGTATAITATVGGSSVISALPTVTVTPGPLSLSQTPLGASSSTVVSGSSINLSVTLKDAAGNNLGTPGQTVVFSRSGGTSLGTLSATTDGGTGTYTATFMGTTVGTATTLSATVGGAALTSALPTVTVIPGVISLAQSTVTIAGSPSTVASGSSVSLLLTARDSNANLISTGGQTIIFTSTGGSSTGNLSSTSDNGSGTYGATFTGVIAGTANVMGATIGGIQITSSKPSLSVVPGSPSLANSLLTLGSASILSANTTVLTLTTKDMNGNFLTAGGSTVAFNRSGGQSTGSISATNDNGNGAYTAVFTGIVSGTATTVGATINALAVTSTVPTITVTPGAASLAQSILGVSSSTLAAGATATLTLTVKDSNGNRLTVGGRTIVLGTSGGTSTGSIGSVTDANNGLYTATFTAATAGTATTLTASINGLAITSVLPTVTVGTGTISPTQSTVTIATSNLTAAVSTSVTLTLKDGSGNPVTDSSQASNITFSVLATGTSSGSFGAVVPVGGSPGVYQVNFTAVTSGTANTIGAVLAGTGNFSTTPTFTVTSGPVSATLSSATASSTTVLGNGIATSTITVTLLDSSSNPIPAKSVSLTSNRGGSDTISAASGPSSASGVVNFIVKSAVQGTSTYTATDNSDGVTVTMTPAITFVSGAVSPATSTHVATPATNVIANNLTTSSIVVTLLDSSSNPVSGKSVALTSSRSSFDTISPASATTAANGQSVFTVKSNTIGISVYTATDTTDSNLVVTQTSSVAFIPGPISQAVSTLVASAGPVSLATNAIITATARDANSNPIAGKTMTLASSRAGVDTIGPASVATNASGVAVFTVQSSSYGTSVYTATDTTDTVSFTQTASILYQGLATAADSLVSAGPRSVKADGAAVITVTVTLKNAALQTIPSKTVTLTSSRGAGDTISPASAISNASGVAIFTVTSLSPGTATLTAIDTSDAVTLSNPGVIQFLTATPAVDYQARLAASGTGPGSNSPATAYWKDLAQSSTANDGQLNLFGYNAANGWTGAGTQASPYALKFDGATHSAYSDIGAAMNGSADLSFETWYMPTASTTRGSVIVSNGSSSIAGSTSTDLGLTLKQSTVAPRALQISIGAKSYADEVMADSPLAYYRLSDKSATATVDSSTYGNNGYYSTSGVTYGSTGALPGDSDTAPILDGVAGNFATAGTTLATSVFTYEFWANPTTAMGGTPFATATSGITGCNTTNGTFMAYIANTNFAGVEVAVGTNGVSVSEHTGAHAPIVAAYNAALSGWNHIVVVSNSVSSMQIYVNGVLQATAVNTAKIRQLALTNIGVKSSCNNKFFAGKIDEAAIYQTALSPTRIQAHYAARTRTACTSMSTLTNNVWHSISGTFNNSTSRLNLFVDGALECSVANAGTTYSGSTNTMRVGVDSAGANPVSGSVADLRLYNSVLLTGNIATNLTSTRSQFAPPYSSVVLSDNPLAYWRMGETGGTTATNLGSAGAASNGTYTGGFTLNQTGAMPSDPSPSASFNGSTGYMTAPVNLSTTQTVTVEFWLYKSSYANDDGLALELTTNVNNFATGFFVDPNGSNGFFRSCHKGDAGYTCGDFTRPSAGVWHHYVSVFDKSRSTNEISTYVDGILTSLNFGAGNSNNTNNFANANLYIMTRGGSSLFTNGLIQDVAIYVGTLSSDRVMTHYLKGIRP